MGQQSEEIRTPHQGSKSPDYLPTLDGWRAIAILLVMFFHGSLLTLGSLSDRWIFLYGYQGVDVFFAISGLLICWRLMQEEARTGRISLRNFYIRRTFRILPAAFAFLAVLAVLGTIHFLPVGIKNWFGAAFFYSNYTRLLSPPSVEPFFTNHFWSLSVEEHFYLLLPGLLIFTGKRFRVPMLLLIALVVIIHRGLTLRHLPYLVVIHHTDIRLDALLFPAAIAILMQREATREMFRRALRFWPLLALAVALLMPVNEGAFWKSVVMVPLLTLMVLGSVLNSENVFGRMLESKLFKFVGRISYSLYLWQELFFTGHYVQGKPFGAFSRFPLQVLATFACALLSYHLLEKPMIRLGHRFAPSPQRVKRALGS